MNKLNTISVFLLSSLLISCSAKQLPLQSQIEIAKEQKAFFQLNDEVEIKATNAKPTILKPGTRWMLVGSINQGEVYRTKDQVVIVNSFNVHEGYIVVEHNSVVGYYLPVEKTFVESIHTPIKFSNMED